MTTMAGLLPLATLLECNMTWHMPQAIPTGMQSRIDWRLLFLCSSRCSRHLGEAAETLDRMNRPRLPRRRSTGQVSHSKGRAPWTVLAATFSRLERLLDDGLLGKPYPRWIMRPFPRKYDTTAQRHGHSAWHGMAAAEAIG
jgi:hypothetical protein